MRFVPVDLTYLIFVLRASGDGLLSTVTQSSQLLIYLLSEYAPETKKLISLRGLNVKNTAVSMVSRRDLNVKNTATGTISS